MNVFPTERLRRGVGHALLRAEETVLVEDALVNLVAETLMALGMEAVVTVELRLRKRRRGLSEYDKL